MRPSGEAWTIKELVRWATDDFRSRGIESPRLDAEVLLAHALGTTRMQLILDADKSLSSLELTRFREYVTRRRAREPVAYIRGVREFYGREFRVDARVLVPRPDTETLVEVALLRSRDVSMSMRALDVCTGSGCVAITLAKERPTSHVLGVDVSASAVALARENARALGAYRASFAVGDLFEPIGRVWPFGLFDVVTANPPYIPTDEIPTLLPDVSNHEPKLALDGGADGLDLVRRVIAGAPPLLGSRGVLAMEVGAGQAGQVAALFEQAGLVSIEVTRDYAGIPRVVHAVRGATP